MSKTGKTIDTERLLAAWGWGAGETGELGKDWEWIENFFLGDENILKLIVVITVQVWTHQNLLNCTL